jgi:ssRNA-specific RNase YbeY (16S rRNA maturation enzyme)
VTFRTLLDTWQQKGQPLLAADEYRVQLAVDDAARIQALAEMFPGRSREEIITDLLSVALKELEAAMPYVRGNKVISRDEQGDPVYEDAGPTPRFNELVRRHRRRLGGTAKRPSEK